MILAEQERIENAKKELNEKKSVADEETINTRNQQLCQIATDHEQIEQNTREYTTIQEVRDNLLGALFASKTPYKNFFQSMNQKITTQAYSTHLYQMEIRRQKMLTEGIEAQKNNEITSNQSKNRK
jgi:hypothetical protein